jgi:hypothetical protein
MLSLHKPVTFKVIVSRDECFFKVCNNILSVHALIVFKMFCFLVDEKIKMNNQNQSCSFENLKILPVTRFKDPKAAILTLKILDFPEAACDSVK